MRVRLWWALLGVVGLVSTAAGQTTPQPAADAKTGNGFLIRMDIHATEEGRPVEDLAAADIVLTEDGAPQTLESYQHITAPSRTFVIFLDTAHMRFPGARDVRVPLVRFLDRLVDDDDEIGVMTAEMAPDKIQFGTKEAAISQIMGDEALWERARIGARDAKEDRYSQCFPANQYRDVGVEMQERRRESSTLEAFERLMALLASSRERRTAIVTLTDGWRLFGPSSRLAGPLVENRAGGFGGGGGGGGRGRGGFPRGGGRGGQRGQPAGGGGGDDGSDVSGVSRTECEADRLELAALDDVRRLDRIADAANRSLASFYTVYARGLAAQQTANGKVPAALEDEERDPASRMDAMRQLASNTDGMQIASLSALESAITRITADMSGYDLLAYRSTNTKLDGRFRSVMVRTSRPGVVLRTRRGYRGASVEEVLGGSTTSSAVDSAFGTVASVSPRAVFRIRTATARTEPAPDATLWVVGELDYKARRDVAWTAGGVADVTVVAADGREVAMQTVDVGANDMSFTVRATGTGGLAPGEYAVRVRLRPNNDGVSVADTARVVVRDNAGSVGDGLLWRRGPSTGPKYAMTADPRFRRSDRIRVEIPTRSMEPASARMLDRQGNPNQIPVQVTDRQDESNQFRWVVVDAPLAALAPGNYAIETTIGGVKQVTAFELIP